MSLYDVCHDEGGMTGYVWQDDPKRLGIMLARYKWVGKMFAGYSSVLEVGCSDGFGARVVRQHVTSMDACDIDPKAIGEAQRNMSPQWPIGFHLHEPGKPLCAHRAYRGVFALDVIEHIQPGDDEERFLREMRDAAAVAIIGTPSLESQVYASKLSKLGHVNCRSGEDLKSRLSKLWRNVFLFSMNDEVVHTGFTPMAHYLMALCVV